MAHSVIPQNTIDNGLSVRQAKAIPHLAAYSNHREACLAAGIDSSTYYRWWYESDAFRDTLIEARDQRYESAMSGLRSLAQEAVETIRAEMMNQENDGNTRLRAATATLDLILKHGSARLDARLDAVIEILESHGLYPPPRAPKQIGGITKLVEGNGHANGNGTSQDQAD